VACKFNRILAFVRDRLNSYQVASHELVCSFKRSMLQYNERDGLTAIVRQALWHQSSHIWGFGDCDVLINFELSAKVSELSGGRECCVCNLKLPGTQIESLGVDVGAHCIMLAVVPLRHAFSCPLALCLESSYHMVLVFVMLCGAAHCASGRCPLSGWVRQLVMHEMSLSEGRSH
jgi:hypothetical protein